MQYQVDIDGVTSSGNPVDQVLAIVGNLSSGYHHVSLITQTPTPGSGGILFFQSAVVTVGTGLVE